MTCREFADFISDYLSAELAPTSRLEFERHLELCANCRRYLDGYRETVRSSRQAFDDDRAPVPSDVPEQLVRAILSVRRRSANS